MLLGPPDVLYCPFCRSSYQMQSIISGNTFGGIRFSDGQSFYPMLPVQPQITRCDTCDNFFWIKDLDINENIENFVGESEPPFVRWLEQDEWMEAITKIIYRDPEEETYLRLQLWWVLNNKFRNEDRHSPVHEEFPEELYFDNLNALLNLFEEDDEVNLILLAEIYRELSKFEKALDLLKEAEKHDYSSTVIEQIREKARDKNPLMFKLSREH
jgi:hypothetical protein